MASFRLAAIVALALLAAAPAALAHSTYFTDDGRYRIVTGQLEEPVLTFQKTGLDVCFTQNTTARTPVAIDTARLTATLTAPDGQALSQTLHAQFGRPGCYQFQEAYVLTEPGQYVIDLAGDLNGTAINLQGLLAGGAVDAMENLTFPDTDVQTVADLRARVDQLEARLTQATNENQQLRSRVDALEADGHADDGGRGAPGAPALLLALVLVAVAVLRRRA